MHNAHVLNVSLELTFVFLKLSLGTKLNLMIMQDEGFYGTMIVSSFSLVTVIECSINLANNK